MTETSRNATLGQGTRPPTTTEPLCAALAQLQSVLEQVDPILFTQTGLGHLEGSMGGHVRHVLDHIRSFIEAVGQDRVDYDHRERDTPVESDPAVALEVAADLVQHLNNIDTSSFNRSITVRVMLSDADGQAELQSTIGRELAFVLSHTIHHFALLGAMARAADITLPEHFGHAPSTIAYRKRIACVP